MRFLSTVCAGLLLFCTPAFAQESLSLSELVADLRLLDSAVQGRGLTDPKWKGSLPLLVNTRFPSIMNGSPLKAFHYRLAVGAALQEIGDGHLLVRENPLARQDSLFFPLPVALLDRKIVLLRQCPEYPADLVGKEITAINGMPTPDILFLLLSYAAADGQGQHFAEGLLRINLIPFITAFFGAPGEYRVEVEGQTLEVQPIRTIRAGEPRHPMRGLQGQAVLRRGDNALHLRLKDSTAILVVTSFSRKDKAFFRKAFSRMHGDGVSRLVVDLRGNTGGHRGAAVSLTKRLVDTSFGYSLVRPRGQNLRPFLNKQGRRLLTLARVKYGVGNFYRARQTPQGRSVRFRYKPMRSPYHGSIAVITDGLTFSSSTMVTSWLKQHSDAVFVGSQAGGGYNGNNGGSFPRLMLPRSGIMLQMPVYRLVLDETSPKRDGIVPDVPVRYTTDDVLNHRDAALEAALGALSNTSFLK